MVRKTKAIKRYCAERAGKVETLILSDYDKHDVESSIGDCIADLMHLCAARGIDFEDRLDNARMHFEAEETGGEHG